MIYSSIASTTRNDGAGVGVAQVLNEMRKNVVFTASAVCNIDINALHSMILNFCTLVSAVGQAVVFS